MNTMVVVIGVILFFAAVMIIATVWNNKHKIKNKVMLGVNRKDYTKEFQLVPLDKSGKHAVIKTKTKDGEHFMRYTLPEKPQYIEYPFGGMSFLKTRMPYLEIAENNLEAYQFLPDKNEYKYTGKSASVVGTAYDTHAFERFTMAMKFADKADSTKNITLIMLAIMIINVVGTGATIFMLTKISDGMTTLQAVLPLISK
jgi:hypothetical protein